MRKNATGSTKKVTDAATPPEGLEAASPPGPAISSKTPSQARKRATAKPPKASQPDALPRLSLAALAMGTTATPTETEPAVAKPKSRAPAAVKASKPAAATKVAKAPKVAKAAASSKATPVTKTVKPAKPVKVAATETLDAKPLATPADTKRKFKGIRLSPSLSTPTSVAPAASVAAVEAPADPVIPDTPEVSLPALPEAIQPIRVPAPPTAAKPSFLASAWSALRHPPRPLMAALSVLILAFAGLVALEEISPSEEVASAPLATQAPSVAGPYGEPMRYDQGPYRAVAYRPYGEPSYRGHYDYRQAPYGR